MKMKVKYITKKKSFLLYSAFKQRFIYHSILENMLLYGAETWTIQKIVNRSNASRNGFLEDVRKEVRIIKKYKYRN